MSSRRRVAPAPRRRGAGGFTLLEAVVSLALVSTVVLALAAGLLTAINSSDSARRTQEIDEALSAYAEGFKAAPLTCDSTPGPTAVPGFVAEVTKVQSWDGAGWKTTDPTCEDGLQPHRLTVRLTEDGGTSSVTGQVVVPGA